MKWWYWLVLELLIIFGVTAWIYFFPSEIEYDFAKVMIGFALIYAITECKDIKQEEIKMKKIKGYNIVKAKTNELLVSIEVGNDEVIEKDGYKVIPFYEEENLTVEQNAGENRIEGGILSISGSVNTFRCWKCGRTLPISERTDFVYASNPPKYSCKECEGIKKEKHYRPFEDCNELIKYYQKKYKSAVGYDLYFPSLYKPSIWVKRYEHTRDVLMNRTFLITGYEDSGVVVDNKWIGMDELFEKFKFLDDSPCGLEE